MVFPLLSVPGIIVAGHGVASGRNPESPFPKGSIELQIPVFRRLGLDLTWVHPGTMNVSVSPKRIRIVNAWRSFRDVEWTTNWHPERFSFSTCEIEYENTRHRGMIYYPHVETRTDHFQDPHVVEILAERIDGISLGSEVMLWVDPDQVVVDEPEVGGGEP